MNDAVRFMLEYLIYFLQALNSSLKGHSKIYDIFVSQFDSLQASN